LSKVSDFVPLERQATLSLCFKYLNNDNKIITIMDLNFKQMKKYSIINEYIDGKIDREIASIKLKCSLKTVSRLKNKYLLSGSSAFVHKNTGKIPKNRLDIKKERKIVKLYKKQYNDLSFAHFYDLLVLEIKFKVSFKTVRNILLRNNIKSPYGYKIKKTSNHPLRPPKKFFGELIQMDASKHDWLSNGKYLHLHLAIDDSTSQIVGAFFCEQETLYGYYKVFEQILLKYGIQRCFYTDNRTVFEYNAGKRKTNENIQFKRVCQELGTEIKTTSVAQAKGRVERSFRTHQQRLVNEFKIYNIDTIEKANNYLPEYIKRHNKKYASKIVDDRNLFTPLSKDIDINYLLNVKVERTVLNGNCISIGNKYCMPFDKLGNKVYLPLGNKVNIIKTLDNKIMLNIKNSNTFYTLKNISVNKNINPMSPRADHPWKMNYGKPLKEQNWGKKW
jgi:hypothetical protein